MINNFLAYNEWANRRVAASLKGKAADSKALQLLGHLLTAERIWLERIEGNDTTGANSFPTLSVEECESLSKENQQRFAAIVEKYQSKMDTRLSYRNLSGQEFTTAVGDIITHVMFHGAYHRGQIALAQRTAGLVPVNTDFITYERERN
ncbi:MAG TPA: DinB family protein [Pyrinomonadaceae bacterium]|nr:DinB family protein [Pyrinomonadaceae bacterium]